MLNFKMGDREKKKKGPSSNSLGSWLLATFNAFSPKTLL